MEAIHFELCKWHDEKRCEICSGRRWCVMPADDYDFYEGLCNPSSKVGQSGALS